jgi:hypothetical protein
MPLNTKNNALLLKSGVLATGCGCCDRCLIIKTDGWSGAFVFSDQNLINADFGVAANNFGDGYALNPSLAFSNFSASPRGTMSIVVTGDVVRVTFKFASGFASTYIEGSVVFEGPGASQVIGGQELTLSTVVSNTLPAGVDEYGRKLIDTVGTVSLKLGSTLYPGCMCSCSSNLFDQSQPESTPDTYTLTFTNVSSAPSGPRSTPESSPYIASGRYAGFLPLSSITQGASVVRTGCDSFMPRFSQPIVLRKVAGTTSTYLSDPILVRACTQVRYRFDTCPAELGYLDYTYQPLLYVYSTRQSHPSSRVFTPYAACEWTAAASAANPSGYAQYKSALIYQFGDFATVSPGGSYTPEQQLLCGKTDADAVSLQEGCGGSACPKDVIVTISGSVMRFGTNLDGVYSVPRTFDGCSGYSGGLPVDNYFSGVRTSYGLTVMNGPASLTISVLRSSGAFYRPDNCGCDGRPVQLLLSYYWPGWENSGGRTTWTADDGNTCVPVCVSSDVTLTYSNPQHNGNSPDWYGYSFGNVTVKLQA